MKAKLAKMEDILFEFENGTGAYEGDRIFDMYLAVKAMTNEERIAWEMEWENYYNSAKNGYSGLMLGLTAQALKEDDTVMVKSLVQQTKDHYAREGSQAPPRYIDPETMASRMQDYFTYEKKVKTMRQTIEDNRHIHEKKAKGADEEKKPYWHA